MTATSNHRSTDRQSREARLALLAGRQYSTLSRAQAGEIGFSDSAMQRRVRAGSWERSYNGVYRLAGSPKSWMQEVWAAYLAAGPAAVVSHETASHLHGVDYLDRRPITMTVPHGGHARLNGVFVHQIDDLRPSRVINLAGLPVTCPARVVVELAATQDELVLAKALDAFVDKKRTSYSAVAACFYEVLRPRKPGMTKLARVLEERGDGFVPSQSELEEALFAALAAGGIPKPVRQFPLPGRGVIKGLVDAAFPPERLLIEADGRRWHARIDALRRDHERDTEAARSGYLTLRFVWEQIMYEPAGVCAAIADVLRTRRNLPR